MTPDAVLREWFQRVWNEGDEKAIYQLAHAEAVIHGLNTVDGEPIKGLAPFIEFNRNFRSAFPDVKVHVERTISEGAYTSGHCRITGRHTGPGLAVPPTGKAVRFEGVTILRFSEGLIVESWNFYDFLRLHQQLGLTAG